RGLEGRLNDLDLKKHDVERASVEARGVADALSTLHERLTQAFERLQHTIPQLEARASSATGNLEQRVNAGEAKKDSFHRALTDASHAAEVLAGLDSRIAQLTSGGVLGSVEHKVRRLEQRASVAAAELKRVTRARNDLEHELAHLQADIKKTAEAGRHEAKTLSELRNVAQHDTLKTATKSQRVSNALVSAAGTVASNWRRCGEYVRWISERGSKARAMLSGNGSWLTSSVVVAAVSGTALLLAFSALRSLSHQSATDPRSS